MFLVAQSNCQTRVLVAYYQSDQGGVKIILCVHRWDTTLTIILSSFLNFLQIFH